MKEEFFVSRISGPKILLLLDLLSEDIINALLSGIIIIGRLKAIFKRSQGKIEIF